MTEQSEHNSMQTVDIKLSEIIFDEGLYPRVNGHDPETVQTYARDYVAIAEQYFQKKCLPDECVHHIDGNHENNDPENLVIMKRSQHSRLHAGLMGALDEWKTKVNKQICNTCLFVRLYEDYKIASKSSIDDGLSSFMLSVWISDEAKPAPISILHGLYQDGVSWKISTYHDCYQGKNLNIVRGVRS